MNFSNQRDFTNAIADQLKRMHGHYAGAHFRAAFAKENGLRFLTASVLFRASHSPSRPARDYGAVLFVEEWVHGQDDALARLAQLLHGQTSIENRKITFTFGLTNGNRQTNAGGPGMIGWRFVSRLDREASFREHQIRQAPLLAPGLPPFLAAPDAVNEWVSETRSSNSVTILDQDCIVTTLPDLRATIISAEWVPGLVRIEIGLGVPAEQLELQLLFRDADKQFHITPDVECQMEIEVPGDARSVHIYLVHASGDCISELMLGRLYAAYGNAAKSIGAAGQITSDIENGENDTVEYKSFIKLNDPKESEFVETVISFSNTSGGRIYIGVRNDGSPQGEAVARATFRQDLGKSLELQEDRLKILVREKIKPVPLVTVKQARIHDHPIILADVERGPQRPYSTHDNKVFVRKGATNRLADPHSELPSLLAPDVF